MKASIPTPLPNFSLGAPLKGKKLISVSVSTGKKTDVDCVDPFHWNATIGPDTPLSDYRASGTSGNIQDDGYRALGAQIARSVGQLSLSQGDLGSKKSAKNSSKQTSELVQITLPADMQAHSITNLVMGLALGGFNFTLSESKKTKPVPGYHLATSHLVDGLVNEDISGRRISKRETQWQDALEYGVLLSHATSVTRDLANTPSNIKTPKWLAHHAEKLVEGIPGLKVRVRNKAWLTEKGFGGVLAVAQGSTQKPYFVELVWDPRKAGKSVSSTETTVLVGKGVTFDTGGISLKPAAGMDQMKTDMAGGAAVLAALRALAQDGYPHKVIGLIPMVENMPSGSSYRPGDVVEHYGGLLTEVGNTDAEGRMILADALAYGVDKFKPEHIISVATLTGAAKVALGMHTAAVFSTDNASANDVVDAGARMGERFWPLPLPEYLEDAVDSQIADVKQAPQGPGSITAALFLRRFVDGAHYTHLDIAGPARADKTYDEVVPLASGFGARTLIELLNSQSQPGQAAGGSC